MELLSIVILDSTDFIYLTSGSTVVIEDRPDYDEGVHEVIQRIPCFPLVRGTCCVRMEIFDNSGRTIFNGETLKTYGVKIKLGARNLLK